MWFWYALTSGLVSAVSVILNKKALHNYHILERLEAGIVLTGAEVKSIRAGRIDLSESFVRVLNSEAFLINANIPAIGIQKYEPTRMRKLLLHKNEILSLITKMKQSQYFNLFS